MGNQPGKMHRTKGRHTGVRWKPYQTRRRRGGERVYVAIKRSIYAKHGKKFHPERELLRIRGRELLSVARAVVAVSHLSAARAAPNRRPSSTTRSGSASVDASRDVSAEVDTRPGRS